MSEQKTSKSWYKKWWAITLYVFFGLIVIGSLADNDNSTKQQSIPTLQQQEDKAKVKDEPIVQETESDHYEIENKELNNPFKASFDIRLKGKITKKEIEVIAKKIKEDIPGYDRYFIVYYLPNMEIGQGGWATSHFNPSLSVEILGTIEEEEEKILKNESLPEGEIIGKWLDKSPYMKNITIIFADNGQFKLRQIFTDGSFGNKDLKKEGDIYRYENDFGEYLKIELDGNLGWYSENGKFSTLIKAE